MFGVWDFSNCTINNNKIHAENLLEIEILGKIEFIIQPLDARIKERFNIKF